MSTFIHRPLSHAIQPGTNDLLADATNDLHIMTKTPHFTLDCDVLSPKAKTKSSRPRLSEPSNCQMPTSWNMSYSKQPALIMSTFCYCFATGNHLLNMNDEKLTNNSCSGCHLRRHAQKILWSCILRFRNFAILQANLVC